MNITITILTKNSQRYLAQILDSLLPFDEVVILDSGSTDETLKIAKRYSNVTLSCSHFQGFGPMHNLAIDLARNDWIFSLDSDEIPSNELIAEILKLSLNKEAVYSIQRDNYYRKKQIKWCGWYKERVCRLFNKTRTRFSNDEVHEKVITDQLSIIPLKGSVRHYPYASISDFLTKMQHYSDLFVKQNMGKKKSSISKALIHGFFAFFKSYVLKKGFLGGYEGFLISSYNAHTAFYKYLKLYEANL